MPDFIELRTILTIFHLLGVVIGMGAAFMTDMMFIKSTKDKIINEKEISFIALGSRMVWIGLFLIIISGISLFALSPEEYLNSSKFLAKMVIVAILTINGIFFHFKHLPFLRKNLNQDLTKSENFRNNSMTLFISGGISSISWLSALTLGIFRSIPYGLETILGVYFIILFGAILFSLIFRKIFLRQ